jgi:hypothetical protein
LIPVTGQTGREGLDQPVPGTQEGTEGMRGSREL